MKIIIIAAIANGGVIGKDNKMPWYLPADLRHFKNLTLRKHVIMGRKTFESIGKPLPARENIVITRNADYVALGCKIFSSLQAAIDSVNCDGDVFIIGGVSLYAEALPIADILYLTFIHADIEGDTFFPEIDMQLWRETSREKFCADDENLYDYTFARFERR